MTRPSLLELLIAASILGLIATASYRDIRYDAAWQRSQKLANRAIAQAKQRAKQSH